MMIKEWMRLTPVMLLTALYACTEAPQDEAGTEADTSAGAQSAAPAASEAVPPPAESGATTPASMDPVAPSHEPQALWSRFCAGCHDPGLGHPGTMMLGVKKGEELAVIMGREDLPAEYIKTIVRGGLLEMAPFRPTEISDDELLAHVAEQVSPQKKLRQLERIDEIPKSASGKILRRELRDG